VRHPADRKGAAGFTLLETIVAMAVLAIVLVSALRVSTDGGWRVDRTTHRLALVRIADRLIERADVDLPVASGPLTGTEGGASWRLERSRYVVAEPDAGDTSTDLGKSAAFGDPKESSDSMESGSMRSDEPTGLSGTGRSTGLLPTATQGDKKDRDASIRIGQDDGKDKDTFSSDNGLSDLETKGKLGLWLIRATVTDASGERVDLSVLRLESGS
jgi:prepilin-type N-terminal cleavage/methylation domain-containing protein